MVRNESVASDVAQLMLECTTRLDGSVALVQEKCSHEEFNAYRLAVGKVLGEILLEVLNPLYEEHPELKPSGWSG